MTTVLLAVHAILALTAIVVSVLGVQTRSGARARVMASWLLGSVGLQTLIGDVLYPFYLRKAKPALHALASGSRSAADIFDVKEHLAFLVLALSIGTFVMTRREPKPSTLLRVLFGSAHGTLILVATLGLVVASLRTP